MTVVDPGIVPAINESLEISLPPTLSYEEVKRGLAGHINQLINHDFEKLVYYLYRIDVNEEKMRSLLEQNKGADAAGLLAELIIERQAEKIKSRQHSDSHRNRQQDNEIDENEKW